MNHVRKIKDAETMKAERDQLAFLILDGADVQRIAYSFYGDRQKGVRMLLHRHGVEILPRLKGKYGPRKPA